MSFRIRSSKFRHVYGTSLKREQCYDNIRVSKSSWDSTFCVVNPKFLAVIVDSSGGGAFIVLPLGKGGIGMKQNGRINPDFPLVAGHRGPVLDIAWCPHDDNVIASGSEDSLVKVWHIPDYGLARTLTDPIVDLTYHQRRVNFVIWHPSAQNILLSCGGIEMVIWNVGTGESLKVIENHPDVIFSSCWNWNGSKILTTCKDKKLRIVDVRTGDIEEEANCHEGAKASRGIFLKNGLVFTTGFNKMSERQYSLRAPGSLNDPIVMVELDTSNGVMFPFYDADTNLIYLCGKGDSVIRYFEVTPESPFVHYINTFTLPDPQRGIGMMPKRGCDILSCEIGRFYRITGSGFCQVITMTVPRKSDQFQVDLYPDTPGDVPAITADEWIAGQDADPILISLNDEVPKTTKKEFKVTKKPNMLNKSRVDANPGSTEEPKSEVSSKKFREILDEIKKLKAVIVKHENRIRALEACLADQGSGDQPHKQQSAVSPVPDEHDKVSNNHESELAPDEV